MVGATSIPGTTVRGIAGWGGKKAGGMNKPTMLHIVQMIADIDPAGKESRGRFTVIVSGDTPHTYTIKQIVTRGALL